MDLPVAILAGGLGTRLRPITQKIPKSLVPIEVGDPKPFLTYQIELLKKNGLRHLVLCVGHMGEMIQAEYGDGSRYGVKLEYSFDGAVLLGTGGALQKALPLLGQEFMVLYGDSYLPVNYQEIIQGYLSSKKLGLMTVFKNQGRWDTSNVWFEDGQIKIYDKQNRVPAMQHIDYGISILNTRAFDGIPQDQFVDLTQVFQGLIGKNELAGYEVFQRFYEVGSPAGLTEFEGLIKSGSLRTT